MPGIGVCSSFSGWVEIITAIYEIDGLLGERWFKITLRRGIPIIRCLRSFLKDLNRRKRLLDMALGLEDVQLINQDKL
jgi:hypothetical protein